MPDSKTRRKRRLRGYSLHYLCHDCGFEGSELANVGTCLGCHLRFPLNLAQEVEVYGYDVERLDLLALVNAAG